MRENICSDKEFMKLVDKKKFQAFLFSSRIPFPYCFARHGWIVLNKKGKLDRFDVFMVKNKKGHYVWNHKENFSRPLNKYYWKLFPKWGKSFLIDSVTSKKAEKLIDFMINIGKKYPYKNEYAFYRTPNSNTFIQWIIDKNKYLGWKLNWRFFGRKY